MYDNKKISVDFQEVEQLKRNLYSYEFLKKQIRILYMDKIADINAKLGGLSKKNQEINKGGKSSAKVYQDKKNSLITEKTKIEKDMLDSVAYKVTSQIDNTLQKLSDSDKELIREKFFYEKSYGDIAKELFISKSVVIDRVGSVLRKMVKITKSL